jgi:hypothetical protein
VELTAVLTKPVAPGFEKKLFKNKRFGAGMNSFEINSKGLGLTKESYILTLYCNNKNIFSWIVNE